MRTHLKIIEDAGGYQALASQLGLDNERVRFWARRRAIPPEHWRAVAAAEIATLEELAEAAEARRLNSSDSHDSGAGQAA